MLRLFRSYGRSTSARSTSDGKCLGESAFAKSRQPHFLNEAGRMGGCFLSNLLVGYLHP